MSARELSPSQARAVGHGEGDACVLAGAGSGKTTVLTERYVALARRPGADVRRIAALTFTERAASEMRERIVAAFLRDPALAPKVRDLEAAPISTIHAYCARLLREHAVEAGVDPSFDLLDDATSRLLREDVWAGLERRLRRAGDVRLGALRRIGMEEAWREVLRLHERRRGLVPGTRPPAGARGSVDVRTALADVARALDEVDAAVDAFRPGEEARAAYDRSRARLPAHDVLSNPTDTAARIASRLATGPAGALLATPGGKGSRPATTARRAVRSAYGALAGALLDEIAAREVDGPIESLLAEYDAEFEAAKRTRGALDFDDLEIRTSALLDALAARGRRLPGAPRAILVDEMQDVNPVQERILARLVAAGRATSATLFGVGDPKQSIYRFRGADVGVIERFHARVGEAGRHVLADSFRSRDALVAFHNAWFPSRFPAQRPDGSAGIPYAALAARAAFDDVDDVPAVELAIVVAPPDCGTWRIDAEAALVADRVAEWVATGRIGKRSAREDGAGPRGIGYGDVAVLLRTRAHAPSYEAALSARGIPFHTGKGRGFYDAREVRDLVHLASVLRNPADPFAAAAFLTSPAVGATDADLLAIFGEEPDEPLRAAAARPSCAEAVRAIGALRRAAAGGSLEEALRAAMVRFDAIPTALLQAGGDRRARNLEKLLRIARRLDEDDAHGLDDFLRYVSDLADRRIDEPEAAAGAPDDVVSLLTVHAAKGLEWPCVIVADAGALGGGGAAPAFHLAPDGAVAWRVRDLLDGVTRPTGGWERLHAEESAAAAREADRLLYVALTRAEERLLVTASVAGRNGDGSPARLVSWGKELHVALGGAHTTGVHDAAVSGASARLRIVERTAGDAEAPPPRPARAEPAPALDAASVAAARARVADAPVGLRRTPYVATISELLLFARSPARYYDERVLGADPVARGFVVREERDDVPLPRDDDDPAADERREPRDDEDPDAEALPGSPDRTALGRAIHLALERMTPGADVKGLVRACVAEELPTGTRAEAERLALGHVERFRASATGRALEAALRERRPVRREAAFHARVRFPDEREVGPFRSLLVRGAVDLWLADDDGRVRVLDHKTGAPPRRDASPGALVERHAMQLRLYALAVERVTGADVAGAALLLLDPEWARLGVPVEAEVDVSGDALRAARDLCLAFAIALHDDRYPPRWTDLLEGPPRPG